MCGRYHPCSCNNRQPCDYCCCSDVVETQKQGGRVLGHSVPCANLEAGDRLEPSMALQDIGRFEALDFSTGEKEVFFWRGSLQTRAKHLNPIFDGDIGVTPEIIVPDSLHCYTLGPVKAFCRDLIWNIVLGGVGDFGGAQEDRHSNECGLTRSDLMTWYDREHDEKTHRSTGIRQGFELPGGDRSYSAGKNPCCLRRTYYGQSRGVFD